MGFAGAAGTAGGAESAFAFDPRIFFFAADAMASNGTTRFVVDAAFVDQHLAELASNEDLSRFIL